MHKLQGKVLFLWVVEFPMSSLGAGIASLYTDGSEHAYHDMVFDVTPERCLKICVQNGCSGK